MRDVIREIEDELKPVLNKIGIRTKSETGHMGNIGKEAREILKRTKSNAKTFADEFQIRTGMKRRGMGSRIKRAGNSIRKSVKNLKR